MHAIALLNLEDNSHVAEGELHIFCLRRGQTPSSRSLKALKFGIAKS